MTLQEYKDFKELIQAWMTEKATGYDTDNYRAMLLEEDFIADHINKENKS